MLQGFAAVELRGIENEFAIEIGVVFKFAHKPLGVADSPAPAVEIAAKVIVDAALRVRERPARNQKVNFGIFDVIRAVFGELARA